MPLFLKSRGYFVSIVSVILLGIVAWHSVEKNDFILACLIGGIAA